MNRSLIYLLAALIAATGVFYFTRPDRPAVTQQRRAPFTDLAMARVARIELEQITDGIALEQRDGLWHVRSRTPALAGKINAAAAAAQGTTAAATPAVDGSDIFPADAEFVQQVLQQLSALTIGNPVSRNPEQHNALQVGALALQVRVLDAAGAELARLAIGKTGPDFFSTYVRIGDEPTVYLIADPLRQHFPLRVSSWRDKHVWAIDADTQLLAVTITPRTGAPLTLTKNAQGNLLVADHDADALDKGKLGDWLTQWTKLNAVEIADAAESASAGLEKPRMTVSVTTADGRTRVLRIGSDNPSGLPYGRLDDGPLLVLPSTLPDILTADWQQWRVAPPAAEQK